MRYRGNFKEPTTKLGKFLWFVLFLSFVFSLVITGLIIAGLEFFGNKTDFVQIWSMVFVIVFLVLAILNIKAGSLYMLCNFILFIFLIGIFFSILNFNSNGLNFVCGLIFAFIVCFSLAIYKDKNRRSELKNLSKLNSNEKNENIENINYKTVLEKNMLGEYIELFEKNRLDNIDIIVNLSEADYEKIGINILGDRKRLIKIFTKEHLINNFNNYYMLKQDLPEVKPSVLHNVKLKIVALSDSAQLFYLKIDEDEIKISNEEELFFLLDNGKHKIVASFNNSSEILEFEIYNTYKSFKICLVPSLKIVEE